MTAAKTSADHGVGRGWRRFAAGTYNFQTLFGACVRRIIFMEAQTVSASAGSDGVDEPLGAVPDQFLHDADTLSITTDGAFIAYK